MFHLVKSNEECPCGLFLFHCLASSPARRRRLRPLLQEELAQLRPGERIEREPPPLLPAASQRSYGQQALGKLLGQAGGQPPFPASESAAGGGGGGSGGDAAPSRQQELSGVWEVLSLDQDGRPFLDRWVAACSQAAAGPGVAGWGETRRWRWAAAGVECLACRRAAAPTLPHRQPWTPTPSHPNQPPPYSAALTRHPVPPPCAAATPMCRRDVWGREDQPTRSVRRPLFGP